MSTKLNVTVLCGGQSTEHEISIVSAKNVVAALDRSKYHVSVVCISRQGSWHLFEQADDFLNEKVGQLQQSKNALPITVLMGNSAAPWLSLKDPGKRFAVDVVMPILHGTLGEDGAPQGLLEMLEVPYVGAPVLGSAISMEKHITKRLLRFAKLPTSDWMMVNQADMLNCSYQQVREKLGEVLFIKPVSLGSSVGISKVYNEQEYNQALKKAFVYDDQALIEPHVPGREIECSVLGNENPVASLPGEIRSTHDFYSYDAKYLDPNGAELIVPAPLPQGVVSRIQEISVAAFKALQCAGMARVDFFVEGDSITINEVNTIPGFTDISMYPKNWEVSGLPYAELLDDLIGLAQARHRRNQALSRVRIPPERMDDLDAMSKRA